MLEETMKIGINPSQRDVLVHKKTHWYYTQDVMLLDYYRGKICMYVASQYEPYNICCVQIPTETF